MGFKRVRIDHSWGLALGKRLGIGVIGAGFNERFQSKSFVGISKDVFKGNK